VLASGAFELKDSVSEGQVAWGPTLFATAIAFASGYAVIAWFMKWISNKSFMPFVWYRVALGIVIVALVSTGVLSPHAAESAG
jgi:undecaprenyl-diphosphatase